MADLESQLEASEREIQKNKDMLQHREKSANVRFYALSSLLSYRMVLEIHFTEIYRLKRKILFSQPFSVFVYIQRVSFPKVMTDYLPTGSCWSVRKWTSATGGCSTAKGIWTESTERAGCSSPGETKKCSCC